MDGLCRTCLSKNNKCDTSNTVIGTAVTICQGYIFDEAYRGYENYCRECSEHTIINIRAYTQKHHVCLISSGKSGVHGGRIIPKRAMVMRPDWCPNRNKQ